MQSSNSGCERSLSLLLRQAGRPSHVVVRAYGQGAWHQYSGQDFVAHLGRACVQWQKSLPEIPPAFEQGNVTQEDPTIILLTTSSYTSFVASVAALCLGWNVLFVSPYLPMSELKSCLEELKAVALGSDIAELAPQLKLLSSPVVDLSKSVWIARDQHREPQIFKASQLKQVKMGNLKFLSIGHDGERHCVTLLPDALLVAAQGFISSSQIPPGIFWQTMETLLPCTPFAVMSRLAVIAKNGVVGFPNPSAEFETNLRILRPTILFSCESELQKLCDFIQDVAKRSSHHPRVKLSKGIEKSRKFLNSAISFKLPQSLTDNAKHMLRYASRVAYGKKFVQEAIEQLKVVVHGLSAANEQHVLLLETLGVPVIETFGTTSAAGILSTNSYKEPHLHSLGIELPHVSFRLGQHSVLQYKISDPLFPEANRWCDSGDAVRMSPFGFVITGRAKHQFVGPGGTLVSPALVERLLREQNQVADVCVVGERMPYLAALLVLSPETAAEYRTHPEDVRDVIQEMIARVNEQLPRQVTIKKFRILEKPFQENLGEKLENGEINRSRVMENYASVINLLYE